MTSHAEEKQIAIKLNDFLIGRLDSLAKRGSTNRTHLMLSFINLWLNVLEESRMPGLFYITNLLRVRETQMNRAPAYEHEFTESRIPEKPIPLKFEESTISIIDGRAHINHISRHQLLKVMIIVGIEDLETIIDNKPFQFGNVEDRLHQSFIQIMNKGFKAFKAYIQ